MRAKIKIFTRLPLCFIFLFATYYYLLFICYYCYCCRYLYYFAKVRRTVTRDGSA